MRVCLLKLERCNVRNNPDSNYYKNTEIWGDIKLPTLSVDNRNKVWNDIRTEFGSLPTTPYWMMKQIWRWRVQKRNWSFDIVCKGKKVPESLVGSQGSSEAVDVSDEQEATSEENSSNEDEENSSIEDEEYTEESDDTVEEEDISKDSKYWKRVVSWERGNYSDTRCHFDCWVTLKIGLNPFISTMESLKYPAKSTPAESPDPRSTKQSTQVEVLLQFGNNFILFNDMEKFKGIDAIDGWRKDGHRRIYSQKKKVITEEISNQLKNCTANDIKISMFKVFKTPPLASPQSTNLPRTLEESNWQIFLEQCNTDLIIISSDSKLVDCHAVLATRDSSVLSSKMAMSKRNGKALLQMELSDDQLTSFLRFQYSFQLDRILDSPRTSIAVLKAAEQYEIGGMWDSLVAALIERDSAWFGAEELAELKIFLKKCSKRAEKPTQDLARKLSPTKAKKPPAKRAKKLSPTAAKKPPAKRARKLSPTVATKPRATRAKKMSPTASSSSALEVADTVGRDNGIWTDKGMKATGSNNDIFKTPGPNKIAIKVEKVELPEKETEETTEMDLGEDQDPGPIAATEHISCDDNSAPSAEEFHIIKTELAD